MDIIVFKPIITSTVGVSLVVAYLLVRCQLTLPDTDKSESGALAS